MAEELGAGQVKKAAEELQSGEDRAGKRFCLGQFMKLLTMVLVRKWVGNYNLQSGHPVFMRVMGNFEYQPICRLHINSIWRGWSWRRWH